MDHLYWLVPLVVVLALGFVFWLIGHRRPSLAQARSLFQQERERLQALFFKNCSTSGKPRGLRWKECQWSESPVWAREKATGKLLALVGVTISFEAVEGGEMEGVEAVGNLRNASAVFYYEDGQWHTGGRAIFNLNPDETIERFKETYERIAD